MSRHWEGDANAYNLNLKYVDDKTGRIVGWASGSIHNDAGFRAGVETPEPVQLGLFTTVDFAKIAVKLWWEIQDEKKRLGSE